ncbi:MAG: hypothetical protein IPL79_00735 [Myxococcales bacterium]|nr:hypothetical protein [Myxococcales bacterium]
MKHKSPEKNPAPSDAAWMRWVDGEDARPSHADGEGANGDPAAASPRGAKVEQVVQELGTVVRGHYQAIADDHDATLANVWTAIARDIAATPSAYAGEVAGVPHPATLPAQRAPSRTQGIWRYVATGVGAAALASIVTLAVVGDRAAQAPEAARVVVPVVGVDGTTKGGAPVGVTPALYHQSPTIESLDVTSGSGTVITVEDADGSTAVIWITPNDVGESL